MLDLVLKKTLALFKTTHMKRLLISVPFFFFLSCIANAQKGKEKIPDQSKNKQEIISLLNSKYDYYKERAMKIWDYAELGYKEEKSTALLQQTLKEKKGN